MHRVFCFFRFFRLTSVVVAVLVLALGCASSGTTGTAGGADVVAPAKKPFQPPAFDSAEFVSEEFGFRIHYPSDFEVSEPQPPTGVLTAASPMMAPRVDVNAFPTAGGAVTLDVAADQVGKQMSQLGGGEATVEAKEEIKLQDGVTKAQRFVVEWTMQGFPLQSVVVVVPSGNNTLNVTVTGLQGGELADLTAISDTLYLE